MFYIRETDGEVMVRIAPFFYVASTAASRLGLLSDDIMTSLRLYIKENP